MAVPIKCQARVNHDGFESIIILKDGSIYGLNFDGVLMELSRSYAGGCIREAMKKRLTAYHNIMEKANVYAKQGDLVDAYDIHTRNAPIIKKNYDAIAKLFKAFKTFKAETDTHEERLEAWREAQAEELKINEADDEYVLVELVKTKDQRDNGYPMPGKRMHHAEAVLAEINKPKQFRKEM